MEMEPEIAHWTSVLQEKYGISATLKLLQGEFDLNFQAVDKSNSRLLVKVMREDCDKGLIELQISAIEHILGQDSNLPVPKVRPDVNGDKYCKALDKSGGERLVWVLDWIDGCDYANFKPHSLPLIRSIGETLARIDNALISFNHPQLDRDFKWNLHGADWIEDHTDEITDSNRRSIIIDILSRYHQIRERLNSQKRQAVHNDANDYNILVKRNNEQKAVLTGVIDFGDMTKSSIIAELAIAGAYLSIGQSDFVNTIGHLVNGYCSNRPLNEEQIELIWPLLLARLAVSVVNSAIMKKDRPGDSYTVISEGPIWDFLEKNSQLNEAEITQRLRLAAGLAVTESSHRVSKWLDSENGKFAPILGCDLKDAPSHSLSVRSGTVPTNPFSITHEEAENVNPGIRSDATWLGLFGEPRLIYTDKGFYKGEFRSSNRRTVHLGVDVFMPAGTSVFSPIDSRIVLAENSEGILDYGGIVTLAHETPDGDTFYTLYGHLDPASMANLKAGEFLKKGESFAKLGESDVNGGWHPHLHFQMAVSLDSLNPVWPGVCDPDERDFWMSVCPNPAALLNLPNESVAYEPLIEEELRSRRSDCFVSNLKLSYGKPCAFLRGWKHYLFDEWGRPYLDAYNNVPHVGHANPRIRQVADDQLFRINTNTRYLHESLMEFAKALLEKVPNQISKAFFVNSGSEANELALRLARAHTGGQNMIVPDHSYFGNTTGAMSISPYKFNKPNAMGKPEWVQVVPVCDTFRGIHRGPDAAGQYAEYVTKALAEIQESGGKLAGFISESFPSVAGQIVPPSGYLQQVYENVRHKGGVCIADEVQTGLGRLGTHYWGFEQQKVIPDVIVLGKPLGNGHPIGAVLTTREIAESFDNGIEFFSTFGGSNLSCRTGLEVIRIVDEEKLQQNACDTGKYLKEGLLQLQDKNGLIGDVRGMGLFLGVELVRDEEHLIPATVEANYVMNRLREERILIGIEGPHENVLKIRPPLTFEKNDADLLLQVLEQVLTEAKFLNSDCSGVG